MSDKVLKILTPVLLALLSFIGTMILTNQNRMDGDILYIRAEIESIRRGATMEELADYFADKDSLTAEDVNMLEIILIRDSE